MATTWTHKLQGTTDTEITADDKLRFAGGTFDTRISLNDYNDSTHVEDNAGEDKSSGNTPVNNNYLEEELPLADSDCALNINFAYTEECEIEDAKIYGHPEGDSSASVQNVNIQMAESGDNSWTNAEGEGSALSLGDKTTAATSHDFYVAYSAGPVEIGETDWTVTVELTYF